MYIITIRKKVKPVKSIKYEIESQADLDRLIDHIHNSSSKPPVVQEEKKKEKIPGNTSKLSDKDLEKIREMSARGISNSEIADKYGIHKNTVNKIKHRLESYNRP